jgi:hypothetical protein
MKKYWNMKEKLTGVIPNVMRLTAVPTKDAQNTT